MYKNLGELRAAYAAATKKVNAFGSCWLKEGTKKYLDKATAIKEKDAARLPILIFVMGEPWRNYPELRIAFAILRSYKTHGDSYNLDSGRYTKTYEDCLIEACKFLAVPIMLWRLIDLGCSPDTGWSNDAKDWVDSVIGDTFDEDYTA